MYLLRLSKSSFANAIVLLIALYLPEPVSALSPPEIDALKVQLINSRDGAVALGDMERCYIDKEADLQRQSSQLQQYAGDFHRREQQLSSDMEQARFEVASFRYELDVARQESDKLVNRMSNIEGQIQIRALALDECKGQLGVIDFLCDWAGELAGLNGELRKLTADWTVASINASSLQQHLATANGRHTQAAERLQSTMRKSAQTKQDILSTEDEIKEVKAFLSEIRTVKQECATQLAEINDAITVFEGLVPGLERDSVARRLNRESTNLGNLLAKAREMLDRKGLRNPNGQRICAI